MTFQQFPPSSSSSSSQTINLIIRERPKTQQQLQAEQDKLSPGDHFAIYESEQPNPEKDLRQHLDGVKRNFAEPLSPRSQRLLSTFKNGREIDAREDLHL